MARPASRRTSPAAPTPRPQPVADRAPSGSLRPLVVPVIASLVLAAFPLLPAARGDRVLLATFLGTAALLLAWTALLFLSARASGRGFTLDYAARKQHWLQACAHLSIYAYWGWHWRTVYASAHLIAAQLALAFALDALLALSRRRHHTLTFGPLPIIFSTNLFLWFKPEWFYLQFVLVTVGFCAKEFIRWERGGKLTHVFNPSSFPLALFSLGLLVTGTTDHTWGREIATTLFYPRLIYLYIFLVGLPGQFFFGVTSMTMPAVVTAFAWSTVYHAVTGSYYFFDSQIPIAVFLGMHLLFTDPSTSPRRELGRIVFGVLYASAVCFLYWLLGALHLDTFYDKLLPVPVLNLCVRIIDRGVERFTAGAGARLDPSRWGMGLSQRSRHLAYMTVWAGVFGLCALSGGFGDTHPGGRYPFWAQACREGKRHGCDNLGTMLASWCRHDVGWACNELGVMLAKKQLSVEVTAAQTFARACELGVEVGCSNGLQLDRKGEGAKLEHRPPRPIDYDVLLDTKGLPQANSLAEVYRIACDQGWSEGCVGLAVMLITGREVPRDPARAATLLGTACDAGDGAACSDLGLMYRNGDGVAADVPRALALLERSCKLGWQIACRGLAEERGGRPATVGGAAGAAVAPAGGGPAKGP